jgi:hypothetical protein
VLLFATNAHAQWGYTLFQTSPCSTNAVTPCQPGEYRSYTMSASEVFAEGDCRPCPAGTFSIDGATWDACAAGHCTACPAGKYVDTEGATSCIACPAGKIQKAGAFLDDPSDFYGSNIWGIARTSGAVAEEGFDCEECPAGRSSDAGAVLANNAVCNNANDMGTMSTSRCGLTGPGDTASAACARGQAECCEKSSGCSTCLDNGSPWHYRNPTANRQNPCLYSYAETPCEIDLNSEGKASSAAGSPRVAGGVTFVVGALLATLA